MDIYFITYHPECGETFLSLFPVGEQSIDIMVRAVAKLRLGNYNLRIENGRHSIPRLPEHLRICQCCSSNEVENEVHFLLSCNRYDAIRKSLMGDIISNYYSTAASFYHVRSRERAKYAAVLHSKIMYCTVKSRFQRFSGRRSGKNKF